MLHALYYQLWYIHEMHVYVVLLLSFVTVPQTLSHDCSSLFLLLVYSTYRKYMGDNDSVK